MFWSIENGFDDDDYDDDVSETEKWIESSIRANWIWFSYFISFWFLVLFTVMMHIHKSNDSQKPK